MRAIMETRLSIVCLVALLVVLLTDFAVSTVVEHDDLERSELRFHRSQQRKPVWQMNQQPHEQEMGKNVHKEAPERPNQPKWRIPLPNGRDALTKASIVYKNGKFNIVPNARAPSAIAYGSLARTLNKTGWDVLDVVTGTDPALKNDTASMYAVGLLEGYLTADRIALMYTNMMASFFGTAHSRKVLLPRVRQFLTRQFEWGRQLAAANPQSAVARHTGFVLAQLQGLIDGYLARNDTVVRDPFVLHLLNAVGDMLDLQTALNDTKENHFERMSQSEFTTFIQASGHCSALIRVTPGLEKIYMGHSSWFVYAATLRMYKNYFLKLQDKDLSSPFISFSSYPGFLESLDDFYILNNGMVVLQTTNNVFNVSLYKSVKPQSLLAWQRVRVANQIARNGSHWAWVINQHNSGTYNNQYMVINLRKIRPNVSIDDGALTIVEQIPTLVVSSDQSSILRTGYFPSYNVPFHEKIYNMSGYPEVVKKRGLDFSYQMAPRAKIFRRQAPHVFKPADMAAVLRFNRFADDPYSEGDSCNSICCRGDLRKGSEAAAFGCYDSKFTDFELARNLTSYAISGPSQGTTAHPLAPFAWSKFPNVTHAGLPSVYNFLWVRMTPLYI